MGHTGHSAVWVAYLVGLETGASGEEILAAQVAANEVAGRLGAACILGPQNGQLWTHIHLAGAAVAAGKLYRLTPEQMTHALGIAYAQPVYGLFPGFMGPGSKLLCASTPALTGLQAARLAKQGVTGNTEIFEDPQGFLAHFSYRPITNMLSGWGSAWLTDTLAIKPYPGCAYIDTTIDGILELRERIAKERGRFTVEDIAAVAVEGSMLTTEMNRLSTLHLDEANLTPININFNIPINVAIALQQGALGAAELTEAYLRENQAAILALAEKVTLKHDWDATLDLLADLSRTVGVNRFFGGFTVAQWRYLRMRLKRDGHAHFVLEKHDLSSILRALSQTGGLLQNGLRGVLGRRRSSAGSSLDGVDFSKVRLPFRSKVTIRLNDGATFTVDHRLPRGSAAKGDIAAVAREKLAREFSSTNQAQAAWNQILTLESGALTDLFTALRAAVPSELN
jgi:2-methylcitrate dehydratase PrpD